MSTEPQSLVSYNLDVLKNNDLIDSYYRSKHEIYLYRITSEAGPIGNPEEAAVALQTGVVARVCPVMVRTAAELLEETLGSRND